MADLSESMWNFPPQQLKILYLHYHNAYGHRTLKAGDLPRGARTHKITWLFNHVVLQDYMTNLIPYNSTTRVAMTTILGRMVTYLDGLLPIQSHDPLIMWSCEIMWQAKTSISPLAHCLWPRNLLGWLLILKGSQRESHTKPRSRGHAKSRDKQK